MALSSTIRGKMTRRWRCTSAWSRATRSAYPRSHARASAHSSVSDFSSLVTRTSAAHASSDHAAAQTAPAASACFDTSHTPRPRVADPCLGPGAASDARGPSSAAALRPRARVRRRRRAAAHPSRRDHRLRDRAHQRAGPPQQPQPGRGARKQPTKHTLQACAHACSQPRALAPTAAKGAWSACCVPMLRAHAACPCCVPMLRAHAACPCCLPMLRAHAACPCC
eukprot:1209336-Pleurochrysis_carterae.AAC.1